MPSGLFCFSGNGMSRQVAEGLLRAGSADVVVARGKQEGKGGEFLPHELEGIQEHLLIHEPSVSM